MLTGSRVSSARQSDGSPQSNKLIPMQHREHQSFQTLISTLSQHSGNIQNPFFSSMESSGAGLFKARRFSFNADSQNTQSFLADPSAEYASLSSNGINFRGATELTKNDKFCVSRLPALPPMLSNESINKNQPFSLNGYTDNVTKCALALNENAINVWPYSSIDDTPLTFEFPLKPSSTDGLQLAILTRPTPGTTLDPGLAIINSISGDVCFYESVQYAPALGMMHNKSIETVVSLSVEKGEYITLAENVEPAGIVVATSWKRVVLVRLRDYKGAPELSIVELTRPSVTTRFFSGWLGGTDTVGDTAGDEIVAIRSGSVSQHGNVQEIIVQEASGGFKKFLFEVSANGMPFVNHRKTVSYSLSMHLERNIDGLIPGSVFDTKFLDLWPSVQDSDTCPNTYVGLVVIHSLMHGVEAKQLLLIKIKIDNSGVLILSSHQLPSIEQFSGGVFSDSTRPRLYIPKPGKTAFVAIGNSVILSDLNPVSSRPSTRNFQYYEPKWEDVVNFKSSVQVIGYGYENKTSESENPALVFITAEHGVVRIERFNESSVSDPDSDPTDPLNLLTSHIKQAVFYADSSFVDFNVESDISPDIVCPAVNSVVAEILDLSSPYLPTNFASTRDSFVLRLKLIKTLIEYSKVNFASSVHLLLPVLVEAVEKLEVASCIWNIVDSQIPEGPELKALLKNVIKQNTDEKSAQDPVRSFFNHNVADILAVLTQLVDDMYTSGVSSHILVQLLVQTLHDAVHKNEVVYIFGNSEIPPSKLWIFDSSLLVKAEEIYTHVYCTRNDSFMNSPTSSDRKDLVEFTETLYFLVTSALNYMEQNKDEQLRDYLKWYNKRKSGWIDALISRALGREALAIAEKYHDFFSVAHILEKERDQTSPEYIFDKIEFFMHQYGYDFASNLFDYYISNGLIQRILVDCKPYTTFLEQYFVSNPEKSRKVSWIYYLQTKDFEDASDVLMALSSEDASANQELKEFNYSLAKLSAVAAKDENSDSIDETNKLDQNVIEAENNLIFLRIQNDLHRAISSFVEGKKELMTLDFLLDNLANPQLKKDEVMQQISSFFQTFVDHGPLSNKQLISLLTSLQPTSRFALVFADALNISALITNDFVFREQASAIWKNLICFTNDWKSISATEEYSDDVNKNRVRETVLFKTFESVQDNKEIMSVLDDILKQVHDNSVIENDKYRERLQHLARKYNMEMWITTIRDEANRE